jgi:hypothetical protein
MMRWPRIPKPTPLPPGHHRLVTIADLIELCRKLPEDRRDLMMSEVTDGIRLQAFHLNLWDAVGVKAITPAEGVTWIDDDGGVISSRAMMPDGTPVMTMQRAKAEAPAE